MSLVAGIDVSTKAIDVVLVDSSGHAAWRSYELTGADAFDRTRQVGAVMPGRGSSFWDDVLAVGIEEPAGRNPGFSFRVQGAVLSMIPAEKLVEKWMPSQWRKAVGLPGNASKLEVGEWAWMRLCTWAVGFPHPNNWSQDACDAYCIALATRAAIEREQDAA